MPSQTVKNEKEAIRHQELTLDWRRERGMRENHVGGKEGREERKERHGRGEWRRLK